jgi:hypothetical protein
LIFGAPVAVSVVAMNISSGGLGKRRIQRPGPAANVKEKNQAAEHREISSRVADHIPEALTSSKQVSNLRSRQSRRDHDQQRKEHESRPEAQQEKEATENLERTDKMGRKVRMCESDSREATHSHIGVDVLQNSPGKKD